MHAFFQLLLLKPGIYEWQEIQNILWLANGSEYKGKLLGVLEEKDGEKGRKQIAQK
jgi:hypothetical protein